VRWAPTDGIKNSEFIGCWDVDVGAAFIPWDKLPTQLDSLIEGSTLDDDSLPPDFTCGTFMAMFEFESGNFPKNLADLQFLFEFASWLGLFEF